MGLLFWTVIQANGQLSKGDPENSLSGFRQSMALERHEDPLKIRDSLYVKADSLKTQKDYRWRFNPVKPYFGRQQFEGNNMVIIPGPTNDKMPNADVKTLGVHYTLKIVPPVGYYPGRYRFNQPYFHR